VEDVTTEVEDRRARTRIYVRREARPRWKFSAFPLRNDSGG